MNYTERSQVLEKVESGELSVEEAIGLMSLSEKTSPQSEGLSPPKQADARRLLHIRVSNLETGASKVNVNVPLSWVKFGWRLGSCFTSESEDCDLDDIITSLDQVADGCIVQVEDVDDNKRVEIYVD